MNCKVKKQAFFGATIALLLSGTALLYMSNREALAVLSMIIFVIDFISLKKANGRYITIGSIFLSLIYFFHCGQSIVELCGYLGNVKNSENLTLILSNAELAESLLFCIFSITFYTLGAILNTDCQIVSSSEKSYIIDVKQCTQLRALGLILLLLSFGPRVYSDVLKWQAYIAGAYINTTFVEVSGLVSILNQFFLFSLVLLVIGNANNPRVARSILYLSIIYIIFVDYIYDILYAQG